MSDYRSPVEWLDIQRRSAPDCLALREGSGDDSYAALDRAVDGLAAALRASGVEPGNTLAVTSRRTGLIARLIHAAPRLGAVLQPLNPVLPSERLERLMRQAGATHLIADEAMPTTVPVIPVPSLRSRSGQGGGPMSPLKLDDVHLVVATSGSSGEPKGVMLTGRNLAASAAASRTRLDLRAGDVWLACLPLFHMGGLSILYRAAEVGAAVWLHERFDANAVWRDLAGGVTHLSLVPAMLVRLVERADGEPPPRSLRTVLVGGGVISDSLVRSAREQGWPLCVSYGLSETSSQAATLCSPGPDWTQGRVGHPLEGLRIEVIPGAGASQWGRLRIRGDMVMAGYANPEHRPGDGLQDGWLVTSDLGRLDTQGELTVVGRADDTIVTGGENVHPSEIEALLAGCPSIRDVAVLGWPDAVWGQRVVALYVGEASAAEVHAWCRANVPSLFRPREFIRVERLPRNAMGKLERHRLPGLVPLS